MSESVFILEGTLCQECGIEISAQSEQPVAFTDADTDEAITFHGDCLPLFLLAALDQHEAALRG